jgi:hypothetical protein
MYVSTGTYPSWNLWNITELDDLYAQALQADQEGNFTRLLEINDEMNTLANEIVPYMVWWHPTLQLARSDWLHGPLEPSDAWKHGWYVNTNYGVDLWSNMYYEEP